MLAHEDSRFGPVDSLPPCRKSMRTMASRYLGIDFGERRVGLAISDEGARISVPYRVIERQDDARLCAEIGSIVDQEAISAVVLGDPVRVDGHPGEASERVHRFGKKLAEAIGLPVEYMVETLTSDEARRRLRPVRRRRSRSRLDAVAAQILLQDFLDARTGH